MRLFLWGSFSESIDVILMNLAVPVIHVLFGTMASSRPTTCSLHLTMDLSLQVPSAALLLGGMWFGVERTARHLSQETERVK